VTAGSDAQPIAQPRLAAGALFFDSEGRVLLVRPVYKPHWDIPGGYVEPGESPLQACRREVREELGIEPPIGSPLVIDWAPAEGEGDKLLFVFNGGTVSKGDLDRISLAADELSDWRFVAADDLDAHFNGRLSRRIRTALIAHARGVPAYAEHGTEAAAVA
jgi:8-oxo-dGTP pyrophosphatase MutT (NUDIX family)